MDRTAKLYKLYSELAVVKRGMEEFAALRPDPREWTQEEVAHHDLLIRRRTGDAELMRCPQALEFPLDASDGAGMCSGMWPI